MATGAGLAPIGKGVRALAVETPENWLEQHRYLNMDDLREHKKAALRRAA
jgi:putative transposase